MAQQKKCPHCSQTVSTPHRCPNRNNEVIDDSDLILIGVAISLTGDSDPPDFGNADAGLD